MRTRINLYDAQKAYKKVYKDKVRQDPRYEGLRQCQMNVIKCNTAKKLCYCKGGTQ